MNTQNNILWLNYWHKKKKTNAEIMKQLTSVYGTHALKSTAVKK